MSGRDVRTLVLVVTIVAVSGFLGAETLWRWQDEASAAGQAYATDLVRRAARVDTLAMSAPHPVLANYDSLVDAVKACRRQVQALEEHDATHPRSLDTQTALRTFSGLLEKRTEQVERLKSQHAGQRNARGALVRWLADETPGTDPQVDALRRALSVFLLAPRNIHEVELVRASKEIESRDAYARISRQVRVLMSTERELTTLIPDILREPLAAAAGGVADATSAAVDRTAKSRMRIRQVGFSATALIALVGLWWPARRRRPNNDKRRR